MPPEAEHVLTTIYTTLNLTDAHLVCSRLEAAGFQASVRNELASLAIEGYTLATGGLEVQVPPPQAEEARAFLHDSKPVAE